jgi:hypothetical protein
MTPMVKAKLSPASQAPALIPLKLRFAPFD